MRARERQDKHYRVDCNEEKSRQYPDNRRRARATLTTQGLPTSRELEKIKKGDENLRVYRLRCDVEMSANRLSLSTLLFPTVTDEYKEYTKTEVSICLPTSLAPVHSICSIVY